MSEVIKIDRLIELVTKRCEFNEKAIGRAVRETIAVIIESVELGDTVDVPRLGKFFPKRKAAGKGRNPKTGEVIYIPDRVIPHFNVAASFTKRVKEAHAERE